MRFRIGSQGAAALAIVCTAIAGCGEIGNAPVAAEGKSGGKADHVMSCQTFAGISHCAIGGATLTLGATLDVTGLAGADGVASALAGVHEWNQQATIDFPNAGGGIVSFTGTNTGAILGGASIAQGSGSYTVTPNFPGSGSYSVAVYYNGAQMASQDDIGFDVEPTRIVIDENIGGFTYEDVQAGIIVIDDTSIRFSFESGGVIAVTLPNGTVVSGNKIVFQGALPPGGPTTLDNVEVTGALDSYAISGETVTP